MTVTTTPSVPSQAEQLKEALDRAEISAFQLSKMMEFKSTSFTYNVLAGRLHMTKPETVEKLVDLIGIDPDLWYTAAGHIPPDVRSTLLDHHELYNVVRNLRNRLS